MLAACLQSSSSSPSRSAEPRRSISPLPGLLGPAVRAENRRRDGGAEDEAAVAVVGGLVDRSAGLAHALDGGVRGGDEGGDLRELLRRDCGRRDEGMRVSSFA